MQSQVSRSPALPTCSSILHGRAYDAMNSSDATWPPKLPTLCWHHVVQSLLRHLSSLPAHDLLIGGVEAAQLKFQV